MSLGNLIPSVISRVYNGVEVLYKREPIMLYYIVKIKDNQEESLDEYLTPNKEIVEFNLKRLQDSNDGCTYYIDCDYY